MIRKISNVARDYAWGSTTLISDYFGLPSTGKPMAEIWFGTHPGSLTQVDSTENEPATTLLHLRDDAPLPYLLKILAAGQPLSIQAHPTSKQAVAGFERENALGIALDSPQRNYKDARHKPEMLVALTEFHALAGFKPLNHIQAELALIAKHASDSLRAELTVYNSLLRDGIKPLFHHLISARGHKDEILDELVAACEKALASGETEFDPSLRLVSELNLLYPHDIGIAISLMMNYVVVQPNQAIQLTAGQIHAYLSGLGVEIMAASDNVLRGGLTPKHIDVQQLQKVLSFEGKDVKPVNGRQLTRGLVAYDQAVEDYLLYRVDVSGENLLADLELPEPSIVLCTAGELAVSDSKGERVVLRRGEAAYLEGARLITIAGSGTGFIATS